MGRVFSDFDDEFKIEETEAVADSLDEEIGNNCNELEKEATTPVRRIVAFYKKLKTIKGVAVAVGLSADHVRDVLRNERDRLSLSDVRELIDSSYSSPEVITAGDVTQSSLLFLIEDQCYRCALSGVDLTPDTASLDHKIPVSKGGKHDIDNVWWVHKDVNAMKGQLTVDEFIAVCESVVAFKGPSVKFDN